MHQGNMSHIMQVLDLQLILKLVMHDLMKEPLYLSSL